MKLTFKSHTEDIRTAPKFEHSLNGVRCNRSARREHLQHIGENFGSIPTYTILVFISICSYLPLYIYSITLMHISLGHLGKPSPQHNIMPFCTFGHLRSILQGIGTLCGCQYNVSYRNISVKMSHIGFFAHITY